MSGFVPDLIVPGFVRSGTTLLFRLLASHPDVVAPRVKETNVLKVASTPDHARQLYREAFDAPPRAGAISMDVSPEYVADLPRMLVHLEALDFDGRIILMIREPVARLHSIFRGYARTDLVAAGQTFADFVQRGMGETQGSVSDSATWDAFFKGEVGRACYEAVIKRFDVLFGPDRVLVCPLEALSTDMGGSLEAIGGFLGLEAGRFRIGDVGVENQAITVRSGALYQAALAVNRSLEPLLNRAPWVRRVLRGVHGSLNGVRTSSLNPRTLLDATTLGALDAGTQALTDYLDARSGPLVRAGWFDAPRGPAGD